MAIDVRLARKDDLDAMYLISLRAHLSDLYMEIIPLDRQEDFIKRYRPLVTSKRVFKEIFSKRMARPDWYIYVACIDERVVGYTLAKVAATSLELRGLFVTQSISQRAWDRVYLKCRYK